MLIGRDVTGQRIEFGIDVLRQRGTLGLGLGQLLLSPLLLSFLLLLVLFELIFFALELRFETGNLLLLDIEALGGGPGRAEDVALKISREMSTRWSLAAGYRLVEGGADVEEVDTFAWLHFAVASVTWRF